MLSPGARRSTPWDSMQAPVYVDGGCKCNCRHYLREARLFTSTCVYGRRHHAITPRVLRMIRRAGFTQDAFRLISGIATYAYCLTVINEVRV